jgi:RNA polymerase sigma-70 factor (ECF subfamily)
LKLSLEVLFQRVVHQNDYQAFEEVFKISYPWLMNYARQLVSDRAEAENAVSEVFYKIWKSRATIRIHRSVKSYLYQAVRNQVLDTVRRTKPSRTYEYAMVPATSSFERSPEEEMIGNELKERIWRAIDRLPPQRRQIFLLSREEGLKYHEIAQRLNISIKTVETQISRSLKTLRELLPEHA